MSTTTEEILQVLREMAHDAALGDSFRVKVDHRSNPAGLTSRFAIFQNVSFNDIVAPEPWLEQLSGGTRGIYELTVSHETNPSKAIGGVLRIPLASGKQGGDPKFSWPALDNETYRGPRDVLYPTRDAQAAAPIATPIARVVPEPRPVPTGGTDLGPVLQALVQQNRAPAPPPGPDPMLRFMEMQAAAERRVEEQRRADLLEQRARDEKERADRREREEKEREREERQREREAEREERREAREREHQARIAEQQQKSQELMIQLLTREPPKDAVRDELLRKAIAGGDEASARAGALIGQMGMVMQQTMGMTLQMLHTNAELNAGPQESPIWGLARTALEGYFNIAGSSEAEMNEALQEAAGTKALPAGEEEEAVEAEEEETEEEETEQDDDEGVSTEKPIDRLDRVIREMKPLGEVADALCLALPTPEFRAAVDEAKGDLRKLIQNRYLNWINTPEEKDIEKKKKAATKKVEYLGRVLPKAWAIAVKRGVISPPKKKPAAPAAAPAKSDHSRATPAAKKKKDVPPPAPPDHAAPVQEEQK